MTFHGAPITPRHVTIVVPSIKRGSTKLPFPNSTTSKVKDMANVLFYGERKMYLLVSSFHGCMKHGKDIIRLKLCVHTDLWKTFEIAILRTMKNCD
jgi:hypothetical protein